MSGRRISASSIVTQRNGAARQARLLPQRHTDHAVDGSEDEKDARPFRFIEQAAEAEDDAALVLRKDLDGAEDVDAKDDDENQNAWAHDCTSEFAGTDGLYLLSSGEREAANGLALEWFEHEPDAKVERLGRLKG